MLICRRRRHFQPARIAAAVFIDTPPLTRRHYAAAATADFRHYDFTPRRFIATPLTPFIRRYDADIAADAAFIFFRCRHADAAAALRRQPIDFRRLSPALRYAAAITPFLLQACSHATDYAIVSRHAAIDYFDILLYFASRLKIDGCLRQPSFTPS